MSKELVGYEFGVVLGTGEVIPRGCVHRASDVADWASARLRSDLELADFRFLWGQAGGNPGAWYFINSGLAFRAVAS